MPRTSDVQLSVSLMFLEHFDILCDLSIYRAMPTWNLFVLFKREAKIMVAIAHTRSAFVVDSF